ncbi:Peptidase S54 rhomboid [Penicillium paradoxum]|uniref:Peptidase S54 rhomboid n=1 Tax=Penicillium paradoxum TaxID=176176 RepID=UPI002548A9EE|nr:Peptidase S54 rhomboid [Penicillium paradoxum]KAJ5772860.1 Peptidase S54 rhomboid [Penicillium paradoxum]
MSNAVWAAWRTPCPGLRASILTPVSFRPTRRDLRITPWRMYSTSQRPFGLPAPSILSQLFSRPSRPTSISLQQYKPVSVSARRFKRTSAASPKPKPKPKSDCSKAILREKPFSEAEIKTIFGQPKFNAKMGNRILTVLHGHRLAGTLDAELPIEIVRAVTQQQVDMAMEWLRNEYPVDEDAAIFARIEREDRAEEEKLVRRAERLGLYKPQSGSYDAELGEEGSPYGKSVLKEARERNEKRLLAEQERKRQEWLDGEKEEQERLQQQFGKDTSLQQYQEQALTEARPRADPIERPYLAWVQKHHIAGTNESPESMNITNSQRLLAPLLFTIAVLGLCYTFAQKYEFPARKDRLMPDVPPAVATVGAIVAANLTVTLLWKYVPPAWRLLNRYFVIVPFYPSALGMMGSTFSHQTWRHLGTNMMVLGLMGTRVHDEIGRGNFLAIYFASGAMGSIFSLTRSVILGRLGMTSLGASAATSGIVAAWCMSHFDDKLTLWILPQGLQEQIWTYGWVFLGCLVGTEIFSLVAPAFLFRAWPLSRLTKMDHAAHLGGYVTGAGCGYTLMQKKKERERKAKQSKWI